MNRKMAFEIQEIKIWWWARCGLRPTADSAHLGNTTSFFNPPEKLKPIASRFRIEDEDNGAQKSCFQFIHRKCVSGRWLKTKSKAILCTYIGSAMLNVL